LLGEGRSGGIRWDGGGGGLRKKGGGGGGRNGVKETKADEKLFQKVSMVLKKYSSFQRNFYVLHTR